jgi:hypothetical protein
MPSPKAILGSGIGSEGIGSEGIGSEGIGSEGIGSEGITLREKVYAVLENPPKGPISIIRIDDSRCKPLSNGSANENKLKFSDGTRNPSVRKLPFASKSKKRTNVTVPGFGATNKEALTLIDSRIFPVGTINAKPSPSNLSGSDETSPLNVFIPGSRRN